MDDKKSGKSGNFLAIDPGPSNFGWVLCSTKDCSIIAVDSDTPHEGFPGLIKSNDPDDLVIEKMSSYGSTPVGAETWNTNDNIIEMCMVYALCFGKRPHLISRRQAKSSLGLSASANDAKVNAALRDMWGEVGTKKSRGPLYGVKTHAWAALAIATAWHLDKKVYKCSKKIHTGPMPS